MPDAVIHIDAGKLPEGPEITLQEEKDILGLADHAVVRCVKGLKGRCARMNHRLLKGFPVKEGGILLFPAGPVGCVNMQRLVLQAHMNRDAEFMVFRRRPEETGSTFWSRRSDT